VGVSQVWMLSRTEERLDPAVIRQTIRLSSHVQSRRYTVYAILASSHTQHTYFMKTRRK